MIDKTCTQVRELHRRREALIRSRNALSNNAKAQLRRFCRCPECSFKLCPPCQENATALWRQLKRGDAPPEVVGIIGPFLEALAPLDASVRALTRGLEALARELPVYPWVESIRGFGALGLAQIVGETGNLFNYSGPAKLWKRMGVAVINGERHRLIPGEQTGYVPDRRKVLHCVGDALIRAGGPYKDLFDALKEETTRKWRERGFEVVPQAQIKGRDGFRSEGHRKNHAQRLMEKRLLKDLWRAWRSAGVGVTAVTGV